MLIAGGRGFLGQALAGVLRDEGHRVTALTRRRPAARDEVTWDPGAPAGTWTEALEDADVLVNLAGASLARGRWTDARLAEFRDSRIPPTRTLALALKRAARPPRVFVSGSAVGYYGSTGDEVTEESPPGNDYLARLCQDWEAAAREAETVTRVVLARTSPVLARDRGMLPLMALPFRVGLGGPVGSGRQPMSWVHHADWTALVRWAIATPAIAGPINVSAPQPVSNREMSRALGRALHRPSVVPAPPLALRAVLGRRKAEALALGGQPAVPVKAERSGFRFTFPEINDALDAIYA